MRRRQGRWLFVPTLALAALVALAAYVAVASQQSRSPDAPGGGAPAGNIEALSAIDPQDERELVGFADGVFVGRVVEQTGSEDLANTIPGTSIPQTQFQVEVFDEVKGALPSMVTVNQQGGYVAQAGGVVTVEEDPLLEPGGEYLFATRHDEKNGWESIVSPGAGSQRIESAEERRQLVDEFEKATRNQIPFEGGAGQ
jgi:hypothetical protein